MEANETTVRAQKRPESRGAPEGQAALLIDFDNVTMGIRSNLGQELRKLLSSDIIKGKVSIQRAYADWRRYPQYIAPLSEASIDLIFAPAYGSSKKNATDIRLSIDALEIVFTRPEIATFILLSGDSDFSSMVLKLKEYGKYVIGVGIQESSSDLLVQNCDEYYSYSSLSGLTSADDMTTVRHDPWELVGRAIDRMVERKDVMRSDRLKQVLLELDPAFSEKEIGFSKFNRFLVEAASKGILSLHKAANGQYEVAPGDTRRGRRGGTAEPAAEEAEERETRPAGRGAERRGRRSTPRVRDAEAEARVEPSHRAEEPPRVDEGRLREAYRLLKSVVRELSGHGGAVRDSEVKRRMLERDSGFDEAALGFGKFSRFLHQAHDEEVVNVERGPEGNFHLSPLPGDDAAEPAARPRVERRDGSGRGGRGARRGGERRGRAETRSASGPGEATRGRGEEGEEEAPERAEEAREPGAETRMPAAEAGEESAAEAREAAAEVRPPAAEPRGEAAEPAPSSRRTLGRFRRGIRGRSGPPAPPGAGGGAGAGAGAGGAGAGSARAAGPEGDGGE